MIFRGVSPSKLPTLMQSVGNLSHGSARKLMLTNPWGDGRDLLIFYVETIRRDGLVRTDPEQIA